jgi:hypothetical protein
MGYSFKKKYITTLDKERRQTEAHHNGQVIIQNHQHTFIKQQ